MNIICVICSDQMMQADHFFNTPCGHVFHLQCLTQWLERSQSCPQCREKVVQSKIHRIYFNFATPEITESSNASVQERVDSLKFQIMLKEKDIKYYTSKAATLEKQNAGLRKEVRKVESELREKISAIHALKKQLRFFKEQNSEYDNSKREIERLKSKLKELKPLQLLLHSPSDDVNKMVGESRDPVTLLTYISIMKKELIEGLSKCKQLRVTISKLQEKLRRKMQLEERLAIAESKNLALQKRVIELEEILGITDHSNSLIEMDNVEDINVQTESTIEDPNITRDSTESSNEHDGDKDRSDTDSGSRKGDSRSKASKVSAVKRKTENIQVSRTNDSDDESPMAVEENFQPINLDDSSVSICTVSETPPFGKRQKMSIGRKETDDTNNLSRNNDNEYENDNTRPRPRRRERGNIKREKHSNKSKNRDSRGIIDLT